MAKKKQKNRTAIAQRRAKAKQKRKQKAKKRARGVESRSRDLLAQGAGMQYDRIEKRFMEILDKRDPDEAFISAENLSRYHEYLKENLSFPCLLTGIEDFPWEERYVFGYGDEREYKELKKTNPSYTDTFVLPGREHILLERDSILVEVERVSDKKWFVLPLEDLETKDKQSPNHQIVESYSYWYVNCQ